MGRNECRLDDRPVRARGSLDADPLGSSPTGHGRLFEGGGGELEVRHMVDDVRHTRSGRGGRSAGAVPTCSTSSLFLTLQFTDQMAYFAAFELCGAAYLQASAPSDI